jgi:large repetitive protein
MTVSHSYDWKAYIFDDEKPRSVYDKADEMAKFVDNSQRETNAWDIDIAAHSTGGLIGRLFVHKFGGFSPNGDPRIKHLMMMGTPNLGIACTGSLESEFKSSPEKLVSAKELFLEEMRRFNQFVVNRNGTKFSALVGRSNSMLCAPLTRGDSVVDVESASAGVDDITFAGEKHAKLTDAKYFGNYIMPRVVSGPRGTYPLPTVSE